MLAFLHIVFSIQCTLVWGCQIPWNWNYRQLWAAMWVLGIEPESFGRAVSALNGWIISPACKGLFILSKYEWPRLRNRIQGALNMLHCGSSYIKFYSPRTKESHKMLLPNILVGTAGYNKARRKALRYHSGCYTMTFLALGLVEAMTC